MLEDVPDTVARSVNVVAQTESGGIPCVVCGAETETREYGYCSQIVVDTCPEGCGVWLDAGEIQALEKFFERCQEQGKDAIPLRWRLWASLHELFGKRKK